MSILTIDLGTFCDNQLMLNATKKLHPTYKIISVTDKDNKTPSHVIKVPFETPSYFTTDSNLKMADPQESIIAWALQHPTKTFETIRWMRLMKNMLRHLVKIPDLKAILILYPALMLLWHLPKTLNIPIYIIYYAPGYPNRDIPWVFDSVLKDPEYPIYVRSKENENSTLKYFRRASMFTGKSFKSALAMYQKATHITAWDPNILPTPKSFLNLKMTNIGALIPKLSKQKAVRSCIFITFGTYSNLYTDFIKKLLPLLLAAYPKTKIQIHNGPTYKHPRVKNTRGYVPYDSIVPTSKLVIFTGSVCLQNICLYYETPMLFVPILTEQYYWAKNYQYETHIPYITPPSLPTLEHIEEAINSTRVTQYLSKIAHSMRSYDAAKNLLHIVNKSS